MSGPDIPSPRLASTKIKAVTVYRNGALVVRRGSGRGLLEVRDLPLVFSSDSLRVRPARGMARDVEETMKLQSVPAPVPVPEEDLDRLRLEVASLDDEIKRCATLLELLQGLQPSLPEADSPAAGKLVDPSAFVGLVGFSHGRARAVQEQKRELEQKKRALVDEQRRLEQRTQAVPTEAPRIFRGVRFRLDESGDVDVEFDIEYFVHAARWVPTWALHLEGARARLVGAALVAQASGEDWSSVHLSVCTTDLARDTVLPSLSSWRIGRAQPAQRRGFRPLATDLPSLFAGFDKGPRRDAPPPAAASPMAPPPNARSGARPEREEMARSRLDDDDEPSGAMLAAPSDSDEGGAFLNERTPDAARAPDPAAAPRMAARMAAAPSAPPMAGGRARARDAGVTRAGSELPPRWRNAYMRMAGADEHQRGSLIPLDPVGRLEWLLLAHEVDDEAQSHAAARRELLQALHVLTQAQARLVNGPVPRGTQAIAGTHFSSLMSATAATDVPGDGTYYRVVVREEQGPASYEHRAVPRESNDVWRACRLDVKGPPLPAGPLAVYENGAFRVNARLDGTGGGQALQVNLGIDPDVRVLSRTVHSKQAEKGLISQTSRVEHHVKVEVRSTAKEPSQLIVHDRLPVPADNVKDVTVAVLEEKPPLKRTQKDARGNEVPGAFEWRVTVMPGDTQVFELKYAIDLPAKAELEGGNRRE